MIEVHPIALKIPPMSVEEYTAFRDDIAKNGLLSPITLFEGKKLDGIHRARACRELGIEPRYETYEGSDPLGFVLSKNLHRRSITTEQRRALAKEYIKGHAEQSDRAIAKETGIHHETVAAVRSEIAEEATPAGDANGGDRHYEAHASEPPVPPPPRVERGLKKDGTPRQARGRKPGTAAASKVPAELGPEAPRPAAGSDEDKRGGEWISYTEEALATRTNDAVHAIVAMIGHHELEIQARIDEWSRRALVGQFARSLGLKLAE